MALALVSISCEGSIAEKPTETAKLLGSLESFDSAATTQRKLGVGPGSWRVRNRLELPSLGKPAQHTVMTYVTVDSFDHLGVRGELLLEFFGDWLSEVRFTPDDWESYRELLEAEYRGLSAAEAGKLAPFEVQPAPFTRLWVDNHKVEWRPGFRRYVGFHDIRLADEVAARVSP